MKKALIGLIFLLLVSGCAQVAPQIIKFDEEYHKAMLSIAETRVKYVACDIGLIDGLGIASSANFPIQSGEEARAILQNPAISLTLGEMKTLAKRQNEWKQVEYDRCKILGLGYRASALGTIDVLKLFPQLAPYLAIFAPK